MKHCVEVTIGIAMKETYGNYEFRNDGLYVKDEDGRVCVIQTRELEPHEIRMLESEVANNE